MNHDESVFFLSNINERLLTSPDRCQTVVKWKWVTLKKLVAHDGRNLRSVLKQTLVLFKRKLTSAIYNPFHYTNNCVFQGNRKVTWRHQNCYKLIQNINFVIIMQTKLCTLIFNNCIKGRIMCTTNTNSLGGSTIILYA